MKRNKRGEVPSYKFQENGEVKISASDNWRTPRWLFDKVQEEFDIVVDRAADRYNHLTEFFYAVDDLHNVLDINWTLSGWANIPYSKPGVWYHKARKEAIERAVTTVLLTKVATSENYWTQTVQDAHVRFLAGRIKFLDETNTPRYGATFPSALVIFSPHTVGRHNSSTWDYRGEKAIKLF